MNKLIIACLIALAVKADDNCMDFEKMGPECATNPSGPYCSGHGDHGHCSVYDCGADAADSQACKDVGYTYKTTCKDKKCQFPADFDCTDSSMTSPCNDNQFKKQCNSSTKKCEYPSSFTCQTGYHGSKCNDEETNIHCVGGQCVDAATYLADSSVCDPLIHNAPLCANTTETPMCDWYGTKCQAFTCWRKDSDDNTVCKKNYQYLHRCDANATGCTFNENFECEAENTKESVKCKEHPTRTACMNKKCVTASEYEASSEILRAGILGLVILLISLI